MKGAAKGAAKRSQSPRWLPVLLAVAAAGAVLAIAMLARERNERRLAAEAAAVTERGPPVVPEAEDEDEEEMDPLLEKLLTAAQPADAPVSALDAAAHALLVREHFEEAEPLVLRALAAAPKDAEAVIHRAVLRGVGGDAPAARAELERLAQGPAGWEASLFAAGFALRAGDEGAALRSLRRFRAMAPPSEVTPELAAEITALERRSGEHK